MHLQPVLQTERLFWWGQLDTKVPLLTGRAAARPCSAEAAVALGAQVQGVLKSSPSDHARVGVALEDGLSHARVGVALCVSLAARNAGRRAERQPTAQLRRAALREL